MSSFTILAGSEITHEMILEALQLDRIVYEDDDQLDADTCFDYFERNNDIYVMALDNASGHVAGYINFSPVRKEIYEEILSGSVVDTVITGDDVLPYEDGHFYRAYYSSIAVHPEYRHKNAAGMMLERWSQLMVSLAKERSIYFTGIVADAVSDHGLRLAKQLGFTFTRPSMHGTHIMTLDLFDQDTVRTELNGAILDVYREYREKNGPCAWESESGIHTE